MELLVPSTIDDLVERPIQISCVRIEDVVYVTKTGCEPLSRKGLDLVVKS